MCVITILSVMCTMLAGQAIFVSAFNFTQVPDDWQTILAEDFNSYANNARLTALDLAGNSQYSDNNWSFIDANDNKDAAVTMVNGPSGINRTRMIKMTAYTSGHTTVKDAATVTAKIGLGNPIDLTQDADYYILVGGRYLSSISGTSGASMVNLVNSEDNSFGLNTGVMRYQPFPETMFASWSDGANKQITDSSLSHDESVFKSGKDQTILLAVSVRNNGIGSVKQRVFYDEDAAIEAPNFNPSYWDFVMPWSVKPSQTVSTLDELQISVNTKSTANSTLTAYFDDFYIYKAPAVSSASSTDRYNRAKVGATLAFDAPAATDFDGNPITIVNKGWYDCTNETPVLLTSDYSYTIPSSMAHKKIKASITVSIDGKETTYEPFIDNVSDDYSISIPSDIAVVARDNFEMVNNNNGNPAPLSATDVAPDLLPYSGGEGFIGGWKGDTALSTDAPFSLVPHKDGDDTVYATPAGELVTIAKGSTISRELANPISTTEDAEYFLVYHYYTKTANDLSNHFRIGNAAKPDSILLGDSRSNNTTLSSITGAATLDGSSGHTTYGRITAGDGTTVLTMVAQLSMRENEPDVLKSRIFVNKPGNEKPSFAPSYWDTEVRKALAQPELDRITTMQNTNAGNTVSHKIKEMAIYKAAAQNVSKSNPLNLAKFPAGNYNFTAKGDVLTFTADAQNELGHDQTVVSTRWLDATGVDAIELSTSNSYTVPSSMVGRFLRLEVVLKDNETNETTKYYPFQQYISGPYEVDMMFFTNGVSGNKTRLAAPPTTDTTAIGVRMHIRRTSGVDADKASTPYVVYIAQYSADNEIKTVKGTEITVSQLNRDANSAFEFYPTALTDITCAEGDYFKVFVLDSKANIIPVGTNKFMHSQFMMNDSRLINSVADEDIITE